VTRVEALARRLDDPLLVTDPLNVRYLVGLESSNTALVVEPDGAVSLYTDFRYAQAAHAVEGVEVVITKRDIIGALVEPLARRRVGIEARHLTVARSQELAAGGADLVPTAGVVEALRAVKDAGEIAAIRRAASLSDEVCEALARERFAGRSERDLAWWIERSFHDVGAEALSFPSIVASGERGSRPHGHPTDEQIPVGTLVTIDMGCVVAGYCSDCTRTFATGALPDELADAYALCLEAQRDGLAAVTAGAHGRDVDAASRVAVASAGRADVYGHGLGHGVGIAVHEAPALRPESEDVLVVGNVVTVEPGLYLPGVGGCRIEDLVVVTDSGCEVLTQFTKELVTVS
jgi:Xaa-Pro aminopeptidase